MMKDEDLTKEEVTAVNKLISKLPKEDLEKAVGGLTDSQKRKIIAAGVILIGLVGGTVLLKKASNDQDIGGPGFDPRANDPRFRRSTYFNSDGSLRHEYEKSPNGVIYRKDQLKKVSFVTKGKNWVSKDEGWWDYEPIEGAVGIKESDLFYEMIDSDV